ncbi:MAG TPA: nucleotidyltransferase family protein [Candidatus Aquilonibacter sp.]|nr:nucleotidyltransferase family protein [Candidatus Aquilonibacter sp.]
MNLPTKSASDNPEWKLLLAAISGVPSDREPVRNLLDKPPDWNSLLRLADRHGVSSLLYQKFLKLADAIPAAALAWLSQGYEHNIHKSLFLTRELVRILDCAEGLGITVIPYKGVVLSEIYYGDIAMRQSGDMDLLVRVRDVARLKDAIRALGYTERVMIPENAEAHYIKSGYEWTFDSAAGKNLLEIQWALQPRFYAVDFDMERLFERAVGVTVAGRRMKTPSPEDLLLVLSLHAAKHVWARLIWLCDIAQILQRELDWEWIRDQAKKLGIERILHVTLILANRLVEAKVPGKIESAIQADLAAGEFAQQIAISIAGGVEYEEQKISYFRLMMGLRERKMDRMRFFMRLAFTPGPGEWEAVRLPQVFFPLYRIVRIARLAGRFVRE